MIAYRKDPNATKFTQTDFMDAMNAIKPSVDDEVLKFYNTISSNMGKSMREKRKDVEVSGLYQ